MSPLKNKGPVGRWLHNKILPMHQASERRLHSLNYLFFELTQQCNLSCRHCGSDCTADPTSDILPFQSVLDVLENIRSTHDPAKITVSLTGGEPLLYPRFFELGQAITSLGFPWGIVSNGWAWTPEILEAANQAGMCTITISLDGPEEVHDWLRGRKGSFARAAKTLRMLGSAPWIQKYDVVTCVHRRNLNQLEKTRSILADLGVDSWRLFTISPLGRAAEDPDLNLDKDEFRQLMSWVAKRRGTPGPAITYSESGYLGACDTTVRSQPFFCRAGITVAGIMADGSILACPNIDRSFAQGNIHQDSFSDVWENRYQVFRERKWMRTGECVECKEWNACQGNSFHLWDPAKNRTRVCYVRKFGLDDPPTVEYK